MKRKVTQKININKEQAGEIQGVDRGHMKKQEEIIIVNDMNNYQWFFN